jgi:predicted deacylase
MVYLSRILDIGSSVVISRALNGEIMPKKATNTKKGSNKNKKVRVAHEMSEERKKAIKDAMKTKKTPKPEWDRINAPLDYKFNRKKIKPGEIRTIKLDLLKVSIGDSWPTSVCILHGKRPGPVVTITGAIHGDELTGPSVCSHLLSETLTCKGGPLDPDKIAGTIRIVPVLNPPGFSSNSRYLPDGRDMNREFPGRRTGNTTQRVAYRVYHSLIKDTDYIIDLHSAAKGRSNMPQVRADLTHSASQRLAKSFGLEVILDSKPPKGSLRRASNNLDIGAITYEGGGASTLDHGAVQVAVNGVINSLKTLHVIPGTPNRPRFRLLASGSTWLRAHEGGLLDMLVGPGSFVEKGDVVATITDPQMPGKSIELGSPITGLFICAATHPFVTAGTPVGHILPITKFKELILNQCDEKSILIVNGSRGTPVWREESDVDEISIEGEWSGGSVDSEWQKNWSESSEELSNSGVAAEEEED